MITEADIAAFRTAIPEFGPAGDYPDWEVRTALDIATRFTGDELMQNFATAHFLSMFRQHSYPMTQHRDGSVTVHFKVPDVSIGEEFWNSSRYGRMFMRIYHTTGASIAMGVPDYGGNNNGW